MQFTIVVRTNFSIYYELDRRVKDNLPTLVSKSTRTIHLLSLSSYYDKMKQIYEPIS